MPRVEIGRPLDGREYPNLVGWLLFGLLAAFMIFMQLLQYFDRTPSVEMLRARAETILQSQVGTPFADGRQLEKVAADLKEHAAADPEAALLFAAVLRELGKDIQPQDLAALRRSKETLHRAGYAVYGPENLTKDRARDIARQVSGKTFLSKLLAIHALEKAGVPDARRELEGSGLKTRRVVGIAIFVGAVVIGLILLPLYLGARAAGKLQPLGFPAGSLSGPDADRLAVRSAQVFLTFLGAGLVLAPLVANRLEKEIGTVLIYLAIVAIILLLTNVPVGGKWIGFRSLGISSEGLGRNVAWGLGAAAANLPLLLAVQLTSAYIFRSLPPAEHPATVKIVTTGSPLVIALLAISASIFAPIIEEIMFRGTLFPALAGRLKSPLVAGLISSIIFAAIHPTGIPAWPGLALIGGMSCFLVYQTRSLIPSMVMHGVHNFGTLLVILLTMR